MGNSTSARQYRARLREASSEGGVDVRRFNPNRPTFATPALTTRFGVMELESGVQHS